MRVMEGLEGLRRLPPGAVLSIGNFDGMHRGHAHILSICRDLACQTGGAVAVVTFEPHPLTVLRPQQAPPRLTPAPLKQRLLADAGVDFLVVLAPEPAVLNLTAEQFWGILRDEVRPSGLVEGDSFSFGKGRGGTVDKLRQWAAGTSVRLEVVAPLRIALLDMSVVPASSSIVRWLVGHGRMRDAAIVLGRPYILEGPVVRGHQRGAGIGMPTANLDCREQLVPADGVYAGRCAVNGRTWPAAVSIGTMPTFGANARQVEAHLVGFEGDLYGRRIVLEVLDWLRDQRRFGGIDALKAKMALDVAEVLDRMDQDVARPIALVS
jgi:riboflavin kinase/FMN adenylyltransferase